MRVKALLIIDMQNDFISGSLPVSQGDEIIPLINELQEYFEIIIASKDWHPKNHVSFASRHHKKPGDEIKLSGELKQQLWPDHCIQNSWGSEFSKKLKTDKFSKVFYKGIDPEVDSYSAFFDNAKQRSTGLELYLRELRVKELYIAGLATDYCVLYTALDAINLGFTTTVILDSCRGVEVNSGDVAHAIETMKRSGVRIAFSHELKEIIA